MPPYLFDAHKTINHCLCQQYSIVTVDMIMPAVLRRDYVLWRKYDAIMSFEEKAFLALVYRLNDLEALLEEGRPVGRQIEVVRGLLITLREALKQTRREEQLTQAAATGPEPVWTRLN